MHIETEHMLYDRHTTTEPGEVYSLHCHALYECYYILRGDVRYLIEGVPYAPAPNSLLLLASGVFHGVRVCSAAPYERITLHFSAACLPQPYRDLLLRPFHTGALYYPGEHAHGVQPLLRALETCAAMAPPLREAAVGLRIAALLTQICHLHSAAHAPRPDAREDAAGRAVAYINTHLHEPLCLESIARHCFISRNQLCRLFAQATGTTVAAYIRQKRLAFAEQLRAGGQTAAAAAANAGFGDYSTYWRAKQQPRR